MRLFRPLSVFDSLYPEAVFRIKTTEKRILLTFDDGPDPDSTPFIIELLKQSGTRAVFFCSGNKAERHPELISVLKLHGHIIGNHGYSHLNGWRTSISDYLSDTARADEYTSSALFRPPYGRITFSQYRALKSKYRVFFWSLMPYDFDPSFGSMNSLKILKRKTAPGSIIVLHDSPSSCSRDILEEYIEFVISRGFSFSEIMQEPPLLSP